MTRKQRLIVIAGIAVSAIFLWLAFQGLNPAAVWGYIQEANTALIIFGAAWFFVSVVVMALRWQYLLRSIRWVPLRDLTELVCIGYMGNNVYPLRAGEVLRIYLLQRDHGVAFGRSTVVVVIERLFDGLVMLTFVFVGLALIDDASPTLRVVGIATAPIFLLGLAIFFVLAAKPNILRRLVKTVSRFLPSKLRDFTLRLSDEVLAGLEGLRNASDLVGTILASYGTWLLEASVYWIVALAFNMHLDFAVTLLMVGVVNLAGLIPASPGQVGVFEFFVILVLTSVGIAESQASAYALVVHLVVWLPVTLVGFFLLARQGLGFNAVARARELENKAVAQ
jgi:uncharacterized protein (TIRG00374 family)